MNPKIILPPRTRHNPNWLKRIARRIGQLHRQYAIYRFYRGLGCRPAAAWDKAGKTL